VGDALLQHCLADFVLIGMPEVLETGNQERGGYHLLIVKASCTSWMIKLRSFPMAESSFRFFGPLLYEPRLPCSNY
ncbi:hypothetical protein Ciccas_009260, partial [Cichlidogyrus casuarinus]